MLLKMTEGIQEETPVLNRYIFLTIIPLSVNGLLIECKCLLIGKAFMNNLSDRRTHFDWVIGLEDISSHIKPLRPALNCPVCKCQSFILRKLLSACNYDRNRAGCEQLPRNSHSNKTLQCCSQLCKHTGCQFKEAVCSFHLFSHSNHAHNRDRILLSKINRL